jgi:hypothetical protein
MSDFTDEQITARLTPNQRSTILGLDHEPCILGCAEAAAKRLAVPNGARPALVVQTQGEKWPNFALNTRGLAIKAHLETQATPA